MKSVGIICEYNPFHNGHLYHINKVKELYPDAVIILIINGYFTMRGEISVLSKEDKTRIALEHGVDLVIELPAFFGTNSADIFASSSIELLTILECNYLVFGSESNDLNKLTNIAKLQLTSDFSKEMKANLKKGLNYPTALSDSIGSEVTTPNDLLGISYIKAILEMKSTIQPITIKRTNNYHDITTNEHIISASNIRNKIIKNESINEYLPLSSLSKINKINITLLYDLIKYKINTDHHLEEYLTVDEGIENRLIKYVNDCSSYNDFVDKIKTKRYTYNRINRMLIHILLGLTKDNKYSIKNVEYIKILGFNKKGKIYLNNIKKNISIPISSKIDNNLVSRKYELASSFVYDMLTNNNTIEFELKNQPIKFD